MNKPIITIYLVALLFVACKGESKIEKDIAKIDIDVKIERFDQLFANANQGSLSDLKAEYPFMFSKRYHDSVWINRINDTLQQQMAMEVDKAHQNIYETEEDIRDFFQHLKYYYKEFKTPRVISVISDVDYRNKTIVTDSIVLLALDTYLGKEHEYYVDIYDYIKQNFESSQILPDLAQQYAMRSIHQSKRKTLMDEMVYFGKLLYFKDVMLPKVSDWEKIGYTQEQMDWALENESSIWQYFVERELLFSTNNKLASRFINPAPFSKFNLELDGESPGRLGQYIGWQIVRAYAKNNKTSIQDIMSLDAETIFNNSRFKPKK